MEIIIKIWKAILALFAQKQVQKPAPVEKEKQEPNGQWTEFHNKIVRSSITPKMLKADVSSLEFFGAKYFTINDWCRFLKNVAFAESSFDRNCIYEEDFMEWIDGEQVPCRSIGLFQLSYGDTANYPNVAALKKFNVHLDKGEPVDQWTITDPVNNITAAIGIMDSLMNGGNVREELGAYWSTIRDQKYI